MWKPIFSKTIFYDGRRTFTYFHVRTERLRDQIFITDKGTLGPQTHIIQSVKTKTINIHGRIIVNRLIIILCTVIRFGW